MSTTNRNTVSRRGFMGTLAATAAGAALPAGRAEAAETPKGAGGIVYTRRLNVAYETDVFVAGGGPAGFAAALAARRMGARVFLAESSGAFGGAATMSYVPAFATFSDGVREVVGGIGAEIRGLVSQEVPRAKYWTPIDLEELKVACDRLATQAGFGFSFFTNVCDAVAQNGRMDHVVLSSKRGLFAVKARVFVDCTGDGDLVAFAGGAFEMGEAGEGVMPCTLCTQWCDLGNTAGNPAADKMLPQAIADGVFSVPDLHLPGFFNGPHKGSSLGRGNIGHMFGVDPTDERSLTKAMIDARRRMPEYERFYKQYLKGYERMRLASTAPYPGIRESRRIVCDYMLGLQDFRARATFPDEIGRYCYPVDVHNSKPGDKAAYAAFLKEYERELRYKKGESYGIPYRSLVAKSFANVLTAGRCMGTDRKMQASIRVMPGCFITGQAAGTAAALAVAKGGEVRRVAADALRATLRQAGAYLPA